MIFRDVKGVRFVVIDNSTHQINADELSFFNEQVASKTPMVLLAHIPLYAPRKSISFGCGNPAWGWKSDNNFELEGRQRWQESGHTETNFNFHKAVFSAPNLMGICWSYTPFFNRINKKEIPNYHL